METFEQKIAETVNKKLNDGTVEKLVEQYMEKGVSEALGEIFSWSGKGRDLINTKLNEVIVPVIEKHDFNQYLTKLDSVLTEIINSTTVADNRRILENFKGLMKQPEVKEIELSEIFEQYCKYVAKDVDTSNLEACCEDGEPYYEYVTARMEVEHEVEDFFKPGLNNCIVKFICEEDEDLNCQMRLYKRTDDEKWSILTYGDLIDINSLRHLNSFEVFLMTLKRGFVDIIMDEETSCDEIEPEEKPQWSLN